MCQTEKELSYTIADCLRSIPVLRNLIVGGINRLSWVNFIFNCFRRISFFHAPFWNRAKKIWSSVLGEGVSENFQLIIKSPWYIFLTNPICQPKNSHHYFRLPSLSQYCCSILYPFYKSGTKKISKKNTEYRSLLSFTIGDLRFLSFLR